MAQKIVSIPEIGDVVLSKRRGSSNIRLSVNSRGQVRVGMPPWMPYSAGLVFLQRKKTWLQKQLSANAPSTLRNGGHIGKMHRLYFYSVTPKNSIADTRVTARRIEIRSRLSSTDPELQRRTIAACERALKKQAEELLPARVAHLSTEYGFKYRSLRIRKLTSRWGSCSHHGTISLSYYLIQLPWELIDYVILHELAHTRHLNHSGDFWRLMESLQPETSSLRKQLRAHRPRIEPY